MVIEDDDELPCVMGQSEWNCMMYLTRLSKISGEFKVQQTEKSDYSDFQKGPGRWTH